MPAIIINRMKFNIQIKRNKMTKKKNRKNRIISKSLRLLYQQFSGDGYQQWTKNLNTGINLGKCSVVLVHI